MRLLDDGADLARGMHDHDHVTVREAVSAPRLRDPVDRDVAGLDGDARLRAVLHQTGQLEELSELDASGH